MKKISLTALLCLLFFTQLSAQEEPAINKKHEAKINAFNVLIFKTLDFSYEYLVNEESSAGVSVLINLNDLYSDTPYYNETFALTPFYRRYFSKKYAEGFFMEGFGMYNVQETADYYYYEDDSLSGEHKTHNFALGISLGAKFVSKRGFAFEFLAGVGRNMFSSDSDYNIEFVPRFATSFGYRF